MTQRLLVSRLTENPQRVQVRLEFGTLEADEGKPVQYPCSYPMMLSHPVCLICISNDEFTYETRMRPIPRKDILKKHVAAHFRLPEYQRGFECRHLKCSTQLEGIVHFKRHAYDVHGVSH